MPRNTNFDPEREPMRLNSSLEPTNRIHGPFSFLNPTQAHYRHVGTSKKDHGEQSSDDGERPSNSANGDKQGASDIEYKWTSRNNRKGRHALSVTPACAANAKFETPLPSTSSKVIARNLWRMLVCYPVWDVSFDVAYIFTIGSVIWCINAFFALLPDTNPSTLFPGEILYGGGITAFIGATVFEIGSVLLMLEAINENRAGCFGWALEQAYDSHFSHNGEHGGVMRISPDKDGCTHHHGNKKNLVGKSKMKHAITNTDKSATGGGASPDGRDSHNGDPARAWVWYPSGKELHTHYLHDIGFLACCSQMIGATIFWISGVTALPGINNILSPGALDGIYWVPQVLGGLGFVISGSLFMIETQKHWWQPAFGVLGWHIGFWNLIGGIGFTLCPCFGFDTSSWSQLQASVSTFWGMLEVFLL